MEAAACAICASPLRAEIEKKDIPGKSAEAISWARRQGINISKFSLAKHRANHIAGDELSADRVNRPSRNSKKRVTVRKINFEKPENLEPVIIPVPEKFAPDSSPSAAVSDSLFLDTVRDMVYQKLLSGEMELKLESGFKAIEIKNKISDESRNEKLLLEILNEIRSDELAR